MPAPSNDNFASAQALSTTLPGTLTGLTTFDATEQTGLSEPRLWASGSDIEQSIWFTFTPTSSGWYKFVVPLASLSYHGTHGSSSGELNMGIFNATADTLAEMTTGNRTMDASMYTDPSWANPRDGVLVANLVASTTYWIKVTSSFGTTLNRSTVDFNLEWDAAATASNANFANRITLTGASGTEDIPVLGPPSVETNEPASHYWNVGFMTEQATVWYEWTCPSSGWYEFQLEETATDTLSSQTLAIYTGSALNALTAIAKNQCGSSSAVAGIVGQTKIRFNATASTVYKIQVGGHAPTAIAFDVGLELRWATASAPTGDTGAAALVGGFNTSRVDNLGNTDDDPPPNGVTRMSPHDDWWYTDGKIGRSKWFKQTVAETGTLRIEAINFTDWATDSTYMEYGLWVYKGASFGSLTNATAQSSIDAVMYGYQGGDPDFPFSGVARALNDDEWLDVNVTAGDVVWLCLATMYDEDINGADTAFPYDAPQGEIDLKFGTDGTPEDPPFNDNLADIQYTHAWYLGRSEFGSYWSSAEAEQREGYTYLATTEGGEAAHAGYGPTRSVWYGMSIPKAGTYKIWVESAADCVLSIYDFTGGVTLGALLHDDDDSGPGNNPLIEEVFTNGNYAIAVDSKTEGFFTLNMQKQNTGVPTPPANDNWEDAEQVFIGTPVTGVTYGATAEPAEREAQELGGGPKDTVWYKYVADHNGTLKIKASLPSSVNDDAYVYVDTWKGASLETLERYPEPPPQGPGGGLWRGFFSFFDTPLELEIQAVHITVENGQTYYIRVQSESGGSEEFTLYFDESIVYLNITAGSTTSEVYIHITPSAVEIFNPVIKIDAGEVLVNITAGGTDVAAKEYLDAATVYINLTLDSHDCHTVWSSEGLIARSWDRFETATDGRWLGTIAYRRFDVIAGDGLEEC